MTLPAWLTPETKTTTGGAKKAVKKVKATKKVAKTPVKTTYKKTSKKVVFKGVERTVYRKDGESFVRRKSKTTGKFYYTRV
jgi:hypothetical protein